MDPLIHLDGGLATTLQQQGLAAFTPVEPWVLAHPDRIAAAHAAFVGAGAQLVLAATFRCLPSEREDWARVAPKAVDLARSSGAETWLTLGPGRGHARVVEAVDVDGVVLETFTDGEEALRAVRAVRRVYDGPLVASLAPFAPLPDDLPTRLARAGVDGLGLNCCSVADATAQLARWDTALPLWLKLHPGAHTLPCRWLGGCCGTDPTALRALFDHRQLAKAGPNTAN